MTNSFNEDDVTHIELTAIEPLAELEEKVIEGFEEREALPHEKAMLINMQLLGGYRHQAMDARLTQEPKTLDLSNFVPDDEQ
jgi:hypothetical protein